MCCSQSDERFAVKRSSSPTYSSNWVCFVSQRAPSSCLYQWEKICLQKNEEKMSLFLHQFFPLPTRVAHHNVPHSSAETLLHSLQEHSEDPQASTTLWNESHWQFLCEVCTHLHKSDSNFLFASLFLSWWCGYCCSRVYSVEFPSFLSLSFFPIETSSESTKTSTPPIWPSSSPPGTNTMMASSRALRIRYVPFFLSSP